uniref:NADH dehydrogenase [ubiquinone] 1 alpha subcomplex subunit 3 n=1 Tax=Mus spicilegus TaxID=10103 RepID=A0A8C6ICX9_MUSSI
MARRLSSFLKNAQAKEVGLTVPVTVETLTTIKPLLSSYTNRVAMINQAKYNYPVPAPLEYAQICVFNGPLFPVMAD